MNDIRFRGFPKHPEFLSVSEAKRALKWIARLHAMFWNDEKSQDWRRDLWTRGGFWTDGKDAINIQTISAQWSQTVRWLQTHHPELVSEEVKGIGKRIQALAGPLDRFLSMESAGPRGTMTHGDYKAANLFLSESRADDNSLGAESVAVVDFQFSGGGLGAEDISYLLFSDARGHYFNDEEDLLQVYHEELVTSLIEQRKGGPSSISLDCLKMQYELSRIDFTRHLLGRGWVASTEGDALLVRALAETLLNIDGGSPLGSEGEYLTKLGSLCGGSQSK
jgi:aminoglycoside phosphotransferase (APT) family kinase protein